MSTRPPPEGFLDALARCVPPERVIGDPGELRVYECDAFTLRRALPSAAVLCASRDEVVAVTRCAATHRVPIVPRGSGTGLSGGATPLGGALVLDVNLMRRILRLDLENRWATVEPGCVNLELTRRVASHGLHFAPDPSSQRASTLGGNVAENAGGPHCLKYGVTTDHVLGLEVVLPSGETVRIGGPEGEGPGCSLVSLMTGSEGTLGVLTEITVRLTHTAPAVRTLLLAFDSLAGASRAVTAIIARGIVPTALEMMDLATVRVVEASVYAAGYPLAEAVLLVELDGSEEAVEEEEAGVIEEAHRHGAREVRAARDSAERERLWKGRKGAYGALGRLRTDVYVMDVVVPRTRLDEAVRAVSEIARRHGFEAANVYHAGDGNLHPFLPYDGRDPEETARVVAAGDEILTVAVSLGGTISGEHGVGLEKMHALPLVLSPSDIETSRALKRAIDPEDLANPGKVFPELERPPSLPLEEADPEDAAGLASIARAPPSPFEAAFFAGTPEIACPESLDELVLLVRASAALGRPVVPAGLGSHAYLGLPPPGDALALSLRNFSRIIEYEPADFTITVEAGCPLETLRSTLESHAQEIPADLPRPCAGTVGGLVASLPTGPRAGSLGSLRSAVLGLRFATGRGGITRSGGRVVKDVAGYDLHRFLAGTLGIAGAIVSVSLKLRPLPAARSLHRAVFRGSREAAAAAKLIRADHPGPAWLRFVRGGDPKLGELPLPAGAAALEWGFEGGRQSVAKAAGRAEEIASRFRAESFSTFQDEAAHEAWNRLCGVSGPGPVAERDLGIVRFAAPPTAALALAELAERTLAEAGAERAAAYADLLSGKVTVRWTTAPSEVARPLEALLRTQAARERSGVVLYLPPEFRSRHPFRLAGGTSNEDQRAFRGLEERVLGALDPQGCFWRGRIEEAVPSHG